MRGQATPAQRRPGASLASRERRAAYVFLLPWALGTLAFTLGPILSSLAVSFSSYEVLHPEQASWVGLDNYRLAFSDPALAHAASVTLLYTALVVPADLVVGLALALLLNTRLKGIALLRGVFFLPVMLAGTGGASVSIALLWLWIFQPRFGLLNFLLSLVGLPPQLWIYSETLVVPSLAIVSIWGVGRSMLVYLAALQGLPAEVLWAAEVDGASAWRRFWRVTLPLVSPALLFNLVLDLIYAFQTFTQAFVVTGGGPGDASLFYMLYLYRNAFSYFRMGYASALAWILLAATVSLTALIFWTGRRWVFYQATRG